MAILAIAGAARTAHATNVARPDLVVFLADDMSYDDSTPYGDRNARTPNLAHLAASGLAFDRAFVASPSCGPSRAALLTGLMPARNGAEANHERPAADIRKLPAYLQAQGYEVVAIGKVSHYEQTGLYGFDHFEHDTFHDDEAVPAAIRWLKARKDKRPLALFVGTNWPHAPWPATPEGYDPNAITLPPKSVDTSQTRMMRARYYAAVSRADRELGDTLAAVDNVLGDDTFVLFSADHGSQWPFRKWDLYDAGLRVPMIVRWKGHVTAGTRTDAMVSWVDILPTLTELAGGKAVSGIDGRSFAALFQPKGMFAGRTEIFATHNNDGSVNVYPSRAVRTEQYKYILNLHPEWVHTSHIDQRAKSADAYFPSWKRAVATDPAAKKVVDAYYHRPGEELYDIKADPYEEKDLAHDSGHAAMLKELRGRLAAWRKAQGDDHPVKGKPHLTTDVVD